MRRFSLPTPLGEKLQSQQPVEVLTRCITIGAGEAATKINNKPLECCKRKQGHPKATGSPCDKACVCRE